jgi:redox-sensitive bicupin YhaK (pirin superfamily)
LTAGAGIDHAELVEPGEPVRAIFFWLRQREPGGSAGFERAPLPTGPTGGFVVVASAKRGGLQLRNDATFSFARLQAGEVTRLRVEPGRRLYLVAPDADLEVDGVTIEAGGRALIGGDGEVVVRAAGATPAALVELPA